ncbi:hypothetical protein GGF50DRAFT_131915 [Schizophyllum commune]
MITLEGDQSPISILPPDVLLNIFDACRIVEDDVNSTIPVLQFFPVRAGPLAVAAVCQRWRDLALDTPTLWTDIHIKTRVKNVSNTLTLLHLLLSRSENLPLIIFVGSHLIGRVGCAEPLIRAVVERSHRWARLDIYKCEDIYGSLFLSRGRLLQLRSVRLEATHTSLSPQDLELVRDLFVDCPLLVDAETLGICLQLPWEQLRRYSMTGHPTIEAIQRTTHAHSLHLLVSSSDHTLSSSQPFKQVTQLARPRLERLTLTSINHLRCFRAPMLSECHIRLCILTEHIRAHDIRLTHPEAATLFGLLLDKRGSCGTSQEDNASCFANVLSLLVARREQPVLLPALRHLSIIMLWVLSGDAFSPLVDIVRSRTSAIDGEVAALQSLALKAENPGFNAVVHAIRRLRAQLERLQIKGRPSIDIEVMDFPSRDRFRRTWEAKWTML